MEIGLICSDSFHNYEVSDANKNISWKPSLKNVKGTTAWQTCDCTCAHHLTDAALFYTFLNALNSSNGVWIYSNAVRVRNVKVTE